MSESKLYKPELLPRRGELNAWALAALATLGMVFLTLRGQVPSWTWFFVAFLAFSAFSISLGNWMDRSTFIRLEADGVVFQNGLRKTRLAWNAVKEVRTFPARWGTAVQVMGAQAHFEFNTLGEVQFQGQVRGRVGFAQGQEIMDEILRASGLTVMTQDGQVTTYSRP